MLLYLATVQGVCLTMGHLVPSRHVAAALSGLVITATGLTSHYLIHSDDLAVWVSWIRSGTQIDTLGYNTFVCLQVHFPSILDELPHYLWRDLQHQDIPLSLKSKDHR